MQYSSIYWRVLGTLFAPLFIFWIARVAPHQRVGDGSEYIAMYYAWKETGRPFLTTVVGEHYEALRATGAIAGMIPYTTILDSFPALKLGSTQDVNHFWFYSLLAAFFGKIGSGLGFFRDPTYAFALLHTSLALVANLVALRFFGAAGLIAASFILVGSPAIWFVDKIHTEFFTVATTLIAVLGLLAKRLPLATLGLALASTQNLSFALPAAVTGAVWLFNVPGPKPSRVDVALVVAAALVALLHPFYYFARFGAFTPQVFGYGAKFSLEGLGNSLLWFFDPDMGLFPNWPVSVAVIIIGGIAWAKRGGFPGGARAYALMALLFSTNFIAQSATITLNSGGTVDIARYAFWYLPFLAPFLIAMLVVAFPKLASNRLQFVRHSPN